MKKIEEKENNKEASAENLAKNEKKIKERKKFKDGFNSFFADFKKFISKGNIIDLSIAVVIGAAFNKIVSSLVNNIIMPLISIITGGVSVADWKWVIKPATYDSLGNIVTAETALGYGVFIQAMIDFLIIALTIFVVLKILVNSERGIKNFNNSLKNKGKKPNENEVAAPQPAPTPVKIESQEDILKDIRTLLQNNSTAVISNKTDENKAEEK